MCAHVPVKTQSLYIIRAHLSYNPTISCNLWLSRNSYGGTTNGTGLQRRAASSQALARIILARTAPAHEAKRLARFEAARSRAGFRQPAAAQAHVRAAGQRPGTSVLAWFRAQEQRVHGAASTSAGYASSAQPRHRLFATPHHPSCKPSHRHRSASSGTQQRT